MSFNMKHNMRNDLLPIKTKRRSGIKMPKVRFAVAHDTGNPNSTAQGNVNYYKNSANDMEASAHVFIDDKEIIICIPIINGAEKAWHVLYNKPLDNKIYGVDANDQAIGIELCYFPNDKARSMKAYEKYVWFSAWLAYQYKLNISKDFIGHSTLDPGRKTDPENAFRYIGKNFAAYLKDVQTEYNNCTRTSKPVQNLPSNVMGTVESLVNSLNVRADAKFDAKVLKTITTGDVYKVYDLKNGLYNIGGNQWVSAGTNFVHFVPNPAYKSVKPSQAEPTKPAPVKPVSKPREEAIRMFKPSTNTLKNELIQLLDKAAREGTIKSPAWKEKAQKDQLPLDDAVALIATLLNRK